MNTRTALLLLSVVLSAGCGDESPPQAEASPAVTASGEPAVVPASAPPKNEDGVEACLARIVEAKKKPALPGSPELEKNRVQMARVRGRAMLWRREPAPEPKLDAIARENDSSLKVVRAFRDAFQGIKQREARRKLVLREGYLFHHDVHTALAIVEQVSLPKIFPEKSKVYIQRGVDVWEAKWEGATKLHHERFVYTEGPYAGEKAEVLLGDRLSDSREELETTPPLVIDLRDLMRRSAFDRIRVQHLADDALVADVRYGPDVWVPALFDLKGARAELRCEAADADLANKRDTFVEETKLLREATKRLRTVVRQMVREQLPFDAEDGKTMGFLRKEWTRAYLKGFRRFDFEGEVREIYTSDGKPMPPQVCIDFLTDAWERASGTWFSPYSGEGKPEPKRTKGGIDFDALDVENRRSVKEFTDFTIGKPELFDVFAIPKEKRFPFLEREKFFAYLHEAADMFRPGDMITIHGYKPGGRPHYHSLLVLAQDPITGVPTLIASNAVFPREQTLEGILQISPKRSMRHRIRVKEPWLRAIASGEPPM
jgi:hypothetical protein